MDAERKAGPASVGSLALLLFVVVVLVGYLSWKIAPLSERMEALEKERLRTRDQFLRETEKLELEIAGLRSRLPENRAIWIRPTPTGEAAGARPTPVAPSVPPRGALSTADAAAFLRRRLLPEDAAIAELMLRGIPLEEAARKLNLSPRFLLAKGHKIEEMLANAPETPAEIRHAIRQYLQRVDQ